MSPGCVYLIIITSSLSNDDIDAEDDVYSKISYYFTSEIHHRHRSRAPDYLQLRQFTFLFY